MSGSPLRIAYQGEPGAFSEEAARLLGGAEAELVPCTTFEELFAAVINGRAELAAVPLENDIAGRIERCYELLVGSGLYIVEELRLPVVQCLIARPGARLEDVRVVHSHPAALRQCGKFFEQHPQMKAVEAEDTAGSVRQMMESDGAECAAIASRAAAERYGASVLAEGIQDLPENRTRFVAVSKRVALAEGADRLALSLQLPMRPGSLTAALSPFEPQRLEVTATLTRERIPAAVFITIHVCADDASAQRALKQARAAVPALRFVGWYLSKQGEGSRARGAAAQ